MKIVSLNAYMGFVFEPLMKFIERHAKDTDIFCLQEIMSAPTAKRFTSDLGRRVNLLQEIEKRLPEHVVTFAVMEENFEVNPEIDGDSHLGIATFVRKDLKEIGKEELFIANTKNTFDGKDYATVGHIALRMDLERGNQKISVINLHGRSSPAHKLDAPERREQSEKILSLVGERPSRVVIMGDFNLFPNTESIRMIERAGFRNLVTENDIQTTRGSHMRVLFPEYAKGPYGFQEFADYTFVTPDLEVTHFSVPDEPISDHLPMLVEIKENG